ncbi:MAG: NAD(P)-binding domain-containing protein, partial [Notoacmeibacter sp.]
MKYGFIGLGNLGGHLAASLLREGFSVCVTDIDAKLAERLLAAGATWGATPQEVAAQSDAVFTCLPSPAVSEMVLMKMLETAKPGMDWIEMST